MSRDGLEAIFAHGKYGVPALAGRMVATEALNEFVRLSPQQTPCQLKLELHTWADERRA